ncbi:hypothetical protein [Chryseobacterium lactis]|uniref:hypothetical protein n=1 Tax=Chryseobacterium lactis TaxID=1241981 RepID=UPI000F50CB76|nr:hypothetical protein [Chryseobacterium lactis]
MMNFRIRTDESAKIQNIVTDWQGYLSVNIPEKSIAIIILSLMSIFAYKAGFQSLIAMIKMI